MVKDALNKLKKLWKTHGREIVFFGGVFLIGIVSFEIGLVEGQSMISKPLVIEVPKVPNTSPVLENEPTQGGMEKINDAPAIAQGQEIAADQKCLFVGSKNSNKYHLPTCSFAKRIKPENRVCFVSEEDAKSKGYQAGCLK